MLTTINVLTVLCVLGLACLFMILLILITFLVVAFRDEIKELILRKLEGDD